MKIVIKKMRCPKCERLVHGKEQVKDDIRQVFCTRCGQLLWTWDKIKWRQEKFV